MTTTEQLDLSDKSTMQFSYGQFLAYDQTESEPGSLWTDKHISQGFVRRSESLGIGTLVQFGAASVRTFSGAPDSIDAYDRVISVPINLPSGILCIEGPEEYPIQRSINVAPGPYRLIAAQSLVSETELSIDIFLQALAETTANSEILKADAALEISGPLLETGDVAP